MPLLESTRRWAEGLVALRVRARILREEESKLRWLRRARTTAPPCWPVAPVTRMVLRAIVADVWVGHLKAVCIVVWCFVLMRISKKMNDDRILPGRGSFISTGRDGTGIADGGAPTERFLHKFGTVDAREERAWKEANTFSLSFQVGRRILYTMHFLFVRLRCLASCLSIRSRLLSLRRIGSVLVSSSPRGKLNTRLGLAYGLLIPVYVGSRKSWQVRMPLSSKKSRCNTMSE